MGMNYSAKIIVGAYYNDLPENIRQDIEKGESFWDWVEDQELTSASEYFDADEYGQVIGVSISAPPFPMTDEWLTAFGKAHTEASFKLQMKPRTIITPDIY